MSDEAERIAELEEMFADDPADALAGFMLGSEYLKAQRAAEAVETFRGVLVADPGYSAAGAGLGRALEALGLLGDARVAWTETAETAAQKGDHMVAKQAEAALARLGGG